MNRRFPPLEVPEGWVKNGIRKRGVQTQYGEIEVGVQRLREVNGSEHRSQYLDPSLDSSGWSPWCLERLVDLAGRMPMEEASLVAGMFELKISRAEIDRLHTAYGKVVEQAVEEQLVQQALMPLEEGQTTSIPFEPSKTNTVISSSATNSITMRDGQSTTSQSQTNPRVMVVQVDGVRVLGQPGEQHLCEGIEIKCAMVYSESSPSERTRVACECPASEFTTLVAGLLRQGKVRQNDVLIGISDGAIWIEELFKVLGIPQIIDVFHATEYLNTLMTFWKWEESTRKEECKRWCRGEVNAKDWLDLYLKPPHHRQGWSEEALTAANYLESRADRMAYKDFKAKGWSIGSGQIEGMNKHVIGSRMKRSGMHWSRPGASRMAAHRAQLCSKRPIIHFADLRSTAFPVLHS